MSDLGLSETSAPPAEITIYWCRNCGWRSITNFNDEGLPCVRCLCPASLHPVKYEFVSACDCETHHG